MATNAGVISSYQIECMLQTFKSILVPVDFTLNTEVAINKALELIDPENSTIHLLHIISWRNSFRPKSIKECEKKLNQWKEVIRDYYPGVSVQVLVEQSTSVQKTIRQKGREICPDLIIIGQTSTHYLLPGLKTVLSMQLAALTRIPVLTIKPGALRSRVKTVVVPISDDMPEIKVHALELLSRKARLNIHLVTFVNDKNILPEISASALLKAYQCLKAKLHCSVQYAVIHGQNKAKAILQYAEKNNTDILLVYPKKETQLSWWNQHISDVLPADSKVQILAVQPGMI